MAPQPAPSPKVCFGPFEFDPAAGELKKYDARVRLQGQPILILTMLLYKPGEVVTREDLRRYLWSGSAMAEADSSLDLAMEKLRHALGDRENGPRYIETLPGRGYRFVGPVHSLREAEVVHAAVDAAIEALPPDPPEGGASAAAPGRRVPRWLLALAALGLVTVVAVIWWTRRPVRTGAATQLVVQAPGGFVLETAMDRQTCALSADGKRLAFTAIDGGGAARVFLADVEKAAARELPGTVGAQSLFWAPDGRSLYVAVKGKLHRVDPAANTSQMLADVPAGLMSGAALSSERLLLSGWNTSLSLTQPEGGLRDLGARFHWPQALPDGEHFLHSLFDASAGRHQIRAALIDGLASDGWDVALADSRALFGAGGPGGQGHLLFVRDGALVAQPFDPLAKRLTGDGFTVAREVAYSRSTGAASFSVSANGVLAYQRLAGRAQFVWVDRAGRETAPVGLAEAMMKAGRISPNGTQIVASLYDGRRGEQDLWLIDTASGARQRVSVAVAEREGAIWSGDGQRLAYGRGSAPQASRVFVRDLREDSETGIEAGGSNGTNRETPGDWSPDGRFLLVVSTGYPRFAAEQQSDIEVVDLWRDKRRRPLIQSRFDETVPAFSPDGRWLAFVSNESGEPEVYAQEFEGGEEPALLGFRKLVTRGGAQALRWRRDGRELFYLSLDGRLYAVPVRWAGDKPEFGQATALFSLSAEARAAGPGRVGFDVAADGERFLVTKVSGGEKPGIVVVNNWPSLAGR